MKNVKWGIVALVGALILGGCSALGLGKNSRTWIEDQVSVVDKVYPTENLFDLFDKFPDGFTIESDYTIEEDSKSSYNQHIELYGDPKMRTISGKVQNIKSEGKPYRETVLMESGLTYTENGYQFENPEVTESDIYFKNFLFQSLTLNKNELSHFKLVKKNYSFETGRISIDYDVQNSIINDFFQLQSDAVVKMHLAKVTEYDSTVITTFETPKLFYSERVLVGNNG